MRLDGLIFDLDGTLVDNLAGDCEAFIRAFAEFGHPGFTPADIVRMFGASSEGIIRSIAGSAWEGCWEAYRRYYQEELAKLGPAPGVIELMDWAREAGFRLGLVTGASESVAQMTLTALGIDRFGTSVRFGSVAGSIKRECIRDLLTVWEMEPHQPAYLGDGARDIEIAKDVGVIGVGAAWCSTTDPETLARAGAAAVFKKPDEVRAWLLDDEGRLGHP